MAPQWGNFSATPPKSHIIMTPENTTVYSYDNPADFTIEYDGRVYAIPAGSSVKLTTTIDIASATISDSATFTYSSFGNEH